MNTGGNNGLTFNSCNVSYNSWLEMSLECIGMEARALASSRERRLDSISRVYTHLRGNCSRNYDSAK